MNLLGWVCLIDYTVSFSDLNGWACVQLSFLLIYIRAVGRSINVSSIENGWVQMGVCIEDAWCSDCGRIALVYEAIIGQIVFLAIFAEVLCWLQASNPVLVVGETLAAWHKLYRWVVRLGHDLLVIVLKHHILVGFLEGATCSYIMIFRHRGCIGGCSLMWTLLFHFSYLFRVLSITGNGCDWFLFSQLFESRKTILSKALPTITSKIISLAIIRSRCWWYDCTR